MAAFSYALVVLRSVRTQAAGAFGPHLSLTVALGLTLLSVGTLVYFVGHMSQRLNVDVVIDLVSNDVHSAVKRLTSEKPTEFRLSAANWIEARDLRDSRRGYLQHIDEQGLWAHKNGFTIKLLVKPGHYIFPGAPVGLMVPIGADGEAAVRERTDLAAQHSSSDDFEYPIRQLVEVAVRALSPGINDPNTAISVIDRLGASLCDLAPLNFPCGQLMRANRLCLEVLVVDYAGLTVAMFNSIRHCACLVVRRMYAAAPTRTQWVSISVIQLLRVSGMWL